ncbi:MAG: hypothetical protein WCG34_03650 [Leptolinea sp.]
MKNLTEILDQATEYQHTLSPLPRGTGQLGLPVHKYLESALHKPESTPDDVRILSEEALKWQIASVYTNPVYLPMVIYLRKDSPISVCNIAGFPLGEFPTTTKIFEARTYIKIGPSEIDLVISVGQLKAGEYQAVRDEIFTVSQ